MSKRTRSSGGSVTGGTGDIKPQIFTISTGTAPATGDYVVNTLNLPVPRFGAMKTKATITELLWVDWYFPQNIADNTAHFEWGFLSTVTTRSDGDTASAAALETDLEDPRSFAAVIKRVSLATSGMAFIPMPIRVDLTDRNGNGLLIATDRITITAAGVANSSAGGAIAKLGYRLVNVGISEYIGIVQSQQV